MKQPDEEARRRLTGEWLHKAQMDLQAAEVLLSDDPPLLFPSCFHSQQAAEKYLKAVLVHHGVDFPKTHDIQEILDLLAPINPRLVQSVQDTIVLTQYAVETRYPTELPDPDENETTAALALAGKVRNAVMRALPDLS